MWSIFYTYTEYVINALVELEQKLCSCCSELGPQVHWSRDELWAGALRSMGDLSESWKK